VYFGVAQHSVPAFKMYARGVIFGVLDEREGDNECIARTRRRKTSRVLLDSLSVRGEANLLAFLSSRRWGVALVVMAV
jgi:hypothetical protein